MNLNRFALEISGLPATVNERINIREKDETYPLCGRAWLATFTDLHRYEFLCFPEVRLYGLPIVKRVSNKGQFHLKKFSLNKTAKRRSFVRNSLLSFVCFCFYSFFWRDIIKKIATSSVLNDEINDIIEQRIGRIVK